MTLSDYRVQQRDYLLSIARALVSRLDLRAVLRLILQAAVDMLRGQVGLIALRTSSSPDVSLPPRLDEAWQSSGRFMFWASYGLPPAMLESFLPLVEDVPEITEPAEFSIPDLGAKLGKIGEETGLLLRQVVALPMVIERQVLGERPGAKLARVRDGATSGKELLGVIFVLRSHSLHFSIDERQILASFADYAAIAVNNARLYQMSATERRRLDALLEASADGIMVLAPDLTVERINRAIRLLTGWTQDEIRGQPYHKIIDWVRLESEQTLFQAVHTGWPVVDTEGELHFWRGRPLYVEGDLRRRNGSMVSVGITYAPLLGRGGRLINIIAIIRDISHFRQADALKDTFISVISHELKTPVSIIKGYAETLRRPEARRNGVLMDEMLAAITEESDRLARLVDDLLDVSRLQAGGLPFQDVEEVALEDLARRVVERYAPHAPRHKLVTAFPEDYPLIDGDPRRLEQVLDNLVSNAIKYSPRGGEVRIVGSATPAEVRVSVQDSGIGVPYAEQERIFERFYRVEGPETRAVPGTGLGLYLARAIVRAHGGRIWVESIPGSGATFHISLPRQTGMVVWRETGDTEV
ncbi:MAG: PAS domain-containing protein [Anaerolineae bacterium]|nr:PAS domain-containing protein [Anaerolineae bacterium]